MMFEVGKTCVELVALVPELSRRFYVAEETA
jgi:hypothetical protein